MSDVNITPPAPASAPSSPAPAPANEVVINQNPTNTPTPVGAQTPEKPVEDVERGHGRPENRREAIKRAFEKANHPEAKKEGAKKAEAKRGMGDNNPPEKMQKELDLRKPPQQERYREAGRFAKAPDRDAEGSPQVSGRLAEGSPQVSGKLAAGSPLPEGTPYRDPLPRFNEKAKAEWATAPESVRGEVHRMAQEFEGAYRKYRSDNETMNTIRPFHELAAQHGTTLQKALTNYVGMEQKLRQDVVGGLDVIVSNLNMRTSDGKKITLRDVAYHILNQSPDQHKLMQNQNAQQAQSQQIGQLHQAVSTLAQTVQGMHHEKVFGQTRSAVDVFADAHPGFDEVGDLIEQELKLGFDLETAYQRAIRLRPPRAAQTRSTTPAQTRSNKSISGAPDSGPSDGTRRRNDKPIGRREAISNAIKRVNGSV
jgi:hypothetical protein